MSEHCKRLEQILSVCSPTDGDDVLMGVLVVCIVRFLVTHVTLVRLREVIVAAAFATAFRARVLVEVIGCCMLIVKDARRRVVRSGGDSAPTLAVHL